MLGERVIGLANSLLHAGAAQLIVTVTPIDDEASAKFFDHLYREMFRNTTGFHVQSNNPCQASHCRFPPLGRPVLLGSFRNGRATPILSTTEPMMACS